MEVGESTSEIQNIPAVDINALPVEILMEILSFLSRRYLLICRRVSKLWNVIATPLCRRKYVTLTWFVIQPETISKTFANVESLPWNACRLRLGADMSEEMKKFVTMFGTRVWKLKLENCRNREIAHVFRAMPHLVHLELTNWHERTEFPIMRDIHLPNLKHFKGSLSTESQLKLFDFICTKSMATRLESVDIQYGFTSAEDAAKSCALLQKIPNIFLYFRYRAERRESVQWLIRLKKHVKGLKFVECGRQPEGNNYFEPLEQMLAEGENILEKLIVQFVLVGNRFAQPLQISHLRNLHTLNLRVQRENEHRFEGVHLDFLANFLPNQFPALKQVIIKDFAQKSVRPVFVSCEFKSVTILKLHGYGYHGKDNWGVVFPNLKKLSAHLMCNFKDPEEERLVDLLQSMKNLENLKLDFYSKAHKMEKQFVECFPLLQQMKELRKFKLWGPDSFLNDDAAYLTLQLKPLDFYLRPATISDDCVAKLEAYHNSFTRKRFK